MGCAKQHVTLPASIQEVQFAQLLRRNGPNIPQAAVANQHGAMRPPRHACDKADIRPARGGGLNMLGELEVDGLMEAGSDPLRATDGCDWWPPVHLETRETCPTERSPTSNPPKPRFKLLFLHRHSVEQSDLTAYTRKLQKKSI